MVIKRRHFGSNPTVSSSVLLIFIGGIFLFASQNMVAQNYCTPTYTYNCNSGDRITKVELAGESQISGIYNTELEYLWTGPNNFTSTEHNPNLSNVGNEHAGLYELTVTYGDCSLTESIFIEIAGCQKEAFINPHLRLRAN